MIILDYYAKWHGEPAAGINPGSESVTITLKYTNSVDDDTVEYWRSAVADYFDGAHVELVRISDTKKG